MMVMVLNVVVVMVLCGGGDGAVCEAGDGVVVVAVLCGCGDVVVVVVEAVCVMALCGGGGD